MMRYLILMAALTAATPLAAQRDSTRGDTALVQNGIYNRPYIGSTGRVAIGGYVEGNTNYFRTDGAGEGFSSELRRFNLFVFAAIANRITFTSELEFEHGTEEIALETALIDIELSPAFVARAGILLVPIGGFNQAHDSPRYDFIDRPLVSTEILPATFSDVGFGAHGRIPIGPATVSYDAYLTNGLTGDVILGPQPRTRIANGKSNDRFEESATGVPAMSGRLAIRSRRLGEIGLSYYRGVYNSFQDEGVQLDDKRHVIMRAIDVSTAVRALQLRGEFAAAHVDVPSSLIEMYGNAQRGFYADAVLPVWRPKRFLGFPDAVFDVGLRAEYVDYNVGTFRSTGRAIADDVATLVPAVACRPTPGTVIRANYRSVRTRDLFGNPAARTAGFQVGFATYF